MQLFSFAEWRVALSSGNTIVIIQLCDSEQSDQEKGREHKADTSQEVKPQGSKSIYSAPLSQIGSSTNLQNSELDLPNLGMLRTNTNNYGSVESSPVGNGSNSIGSETAQIIAEEDLELKQTISRSRNPSSDLVIAPDPVLAEVTKASANNNNQPGQNFQKSQGISNFVKNCKDLQPKFYDHEAETNTLYSLTNFVHL